MYLDHFGFDEPPFSITPDPKFVFLSEKHQESLAHLIYGITRGGGAGFVQLTGEVGTGKTTISRLLLEQIPDKTNVALILNPTISPNELLEALCKELKVPLKGIKGKLNRMIDKLNDYLIKSWSEGETTVVIIDEAQNLPRDTLEQLRLLTNLETDTHKLLQIVLIGQPELRSTMRRNDLRQLAQRVTARYHLMPLSAEETFKYIEHRVKTAGCQSSLFSKSTAKKIHTLTKGVPRLINTVADRSLLAAYSDDKFEVSNKHIIIAAEEVLPENYLVPKPKSMSYLLPVILIALIVSIIALGFNKFQANKVVQNNDFTDFEKSLEAKPNNIAKFYLSPQANESWRHLFQLWGTQSEKRWQKADCPNASEIGMACLRRQGNLKQIERLNHPVILQLDDQSLVLLKSIDNNQLTLLNSEGSYQGVEKTWVEDHWYGTYFILWSMPSILFDKPEPTELNTWALEMANSISTDSVNQRELKNWLKQFQQSNGLLADGIIGPETQMALSLKAYNGPSLTNK